MNCIEVGELMQRRLDFDLNEQETLQLEAHLANCKACKMMFERLSMLSTQLEQLPHVTPSFSIVDSILPQLAEIDKQNEETAFMNNREEAAHIEQWSNKRKSSFTSKKWVATTSGLVAAAAILLTVGITNIGKFTNSEADTAASMTAYDHSAQTDIADKLRARDFDVKVMDQSSTSLNYDNAKAEGINQAPSFTFDHLKQTPTNNMNMMENSEENNMPLNDMAIENEYFPNNQNSVQSDAGSNGEMEWLPAEVSDQFGYMSFARPHSEANLVSPDERFYIELEEHSITVYDFSTDKTIKSFEVPIEGDIVFNGWHEQSIEFYIEVTDEQLQTHNLTFAMGQ